MDAIDLTLRNIKGSALTHTEMDNNLSALRTGAYNATVSFKNKLINGNFDIWQRGTSQTSNGYGSVDRWYNYNLGTTDTASQQPFTLGQTDVPGNPKYFLRHVVDSVTGATNHAGTGQYIEGADTFAGKTVTLSFWAKADANKNIAVEFEQNFGTGGTPSENNVGIGAQLVPLTTSWAKHEITINIPSVAGKTIGTDGNDNIALNFWFDSGADRNVRTASLGQQSGTFDIARVQLEEGSAATAFEERPIGVELQLCQRYYEVMRDLGILCGVSTEGFKGAVAVIFFNTIKRENPTVTVTKTMGNMIDIGTERERPNSVLVRPYTNTAVGKYAYFNLYIDAEL